MIGAKTGRNGHDIFQAEREEGRTRKQDKRERDLGDDESVAKAQGSSINRAGARFRLERIRKMAAQIEPGDRRRDHEPENDRAEEPDRSERIIERDMRAQRQTVRAENFQQSDSPR